MVAAQLATYVVPLFSLSAAGMILLSKKWSGQKPVKALLSMTAPITPASQNHTGLTIEPATTLNSVTAPMIPS